MNLGGPTNAGDLASVASRTGKSDLVHDAPDTTRQGNNAVSDGGRSKAIVEGASSRGELKSKETGGEGKVRDWVSEANKGGPVPSIGYLLLRIDVLLKSLCYEAGKGEKSGMKERKWGMWRCVYTALREEFAQIWLES